MTVNTGDRIAIAMEGILTYVRVHPQARDTAEGIVHWWLPPDSTTPQLSDVQEALDRLIIAGLIRAESVPGGTVVYSGSDSL